MMMKKNVMFMKRMTMAILAVSMMMALLSGCSTSNNKTGIANDTTSTASVSGNTVADSSPSEANITDVTEPEIWTDFQTEDADLFVYGLDAVPCVLEGTKVFDAAALLFADQTMIKGIMVDDSEVDYTTSGKYDLIYRLLVDKTAYEDFLADKTTYEPDFAAARSVYDKTTDDTLGLIKITAEAEVVTGDDVAAKTKAGIPVYTDNNELADPTVTVERPDMTALNTSLKDSLRGTATAVATEPPAPSPEATVSASPTPEPTKAPETSAADQQAAQATPAPTKVPATSNTSTSSGGKSNENTHTHNWVEQTTTVHHEEVGHMEQVLVEKERDEEVVVQEAWDETVLVQGEGLYCDICSQCGLNFTTAGMSDEERQAHLLEELKATGLVVHFYTKYVETVPPHTEIVHHDEVKETVHHDAKYDERWVVDQPEYDETVSDGYKCSICGARK